MDLADRLSRSIWGGLLDQGINPGRFELNDLGVDCWIGDFIGHLRNDLRGLRSEPGAQTFEIILSKVVVLVKYADPGVRLRLQNGLCDDSAFRFEVRIERHGPGESLRIVKASSSRRDEQLGSPLAVQIFLNRDIRCRADCADLGKHAYVLDEFPRLLDGLRGAVGIVQLRELDLAAIDSALLVQHFEIADDGAPGTGTE